jgi:hypothetical protein
MTPIKRFTKGAVMLCSVTAISVVAVAAGFHPGADGSSASRLHAILLNLGPLPADCPTQCEYTACVSDQHMNAEHSQGTNSGTVHGCAFSEGGCTDHICIVTIAKLGGELAEVEALLRAVSDTQLEGLAAQHERLRINRDRNTIQLLEWH